MTDLAILIVLLVWLVCGITAGLIVRYKKGQGLSYVLCYTFGPIGLIVALLLSYKRIPYELRDES